MFATVARSLTCIVAFALGTLYVPIAGDAAQPSTPKPRLGMNLNGPADWNSELPFVDVFRLSRPWISQKKSQPWLRAFG